MEPILLIHNPKSGLHTHEQEIEKGVLFLRQDGFVVIKVSTLDIKNKNDFKNIVKEYKPRTVIAAGGDGSVNSISEYLVGTDLRLAVIPAGTFNHFAKHIGIGINIEEAFKTVINGETINIDTASVNGRFFINFSCVGFYTEVIKRRISYQKKEWKKWSAFVVSLYETLNGNASLDLSISKNDSKVKITTPMVFIGNNIFEFGGLNVLTGRQDFTSGKLHISVMKDKGRFWIMLLLIVSMFIDIKNRLGFTTLALDQIEINSKKEYMLVSLDGELAQLKTPLIYKIQPRSLRVIVPKK